MVVRVFSTILALTLITFDCVSAISIPPYTQANVYIKKQQEVSSRMSHHGSLSRKKDLPLAMAIPGYGLTEQIFVGGFQNFLSIFNIVITARILLSWFPQAQSVGVLQPVYAITDPYLNLFRGLIPPVFGLDLSPLLAFFALNVATSATAAVGCEIDEKLSSLKNLKNRKLFLK